MRCAIGTSSISSRSRQEEFRNVAFGSVELYGGRGLSNDIFEDLCQGAGAIAGVVVWRGMRVELSALVVDVWCVWSRVRKAEIVGAMLFRCLTV